MKMILRQASTRSYVILLLSVLILLSFVSLRRGTSPTRASRQSDTPTVRSVVPNLRVVEVHVQDGALSLSLRNDYNKTITAFAVSSSHIITRSELIDTDQVMAPGAIQTKLYELPSSPLPGYATTVQAVVFDDGTADGNPAIIRQILDARDGNKTQIDRILPALSLDARDGDLEHQWRRVKSRIGELPDQEDGRSFEFNAALQDAKHLAEMTIDELGRVQQKHGDDAVRQRLAEIKEVYGARSMKLQRSLHRYQ